MSVIQPRFIVLFIYIVSTVYMHFRGRVRFKFLRQLFDHTTFLAPFNALSYLFSKVPNKPFVDVKHFSSEHALVGHWETIRDEALSVLQAGGIKTADRFDDVGYQSFFKHGWKRFYLKWYGQDHASAKDQCPKTVALLESIPTIKAALFAVLPVGAKLPVHRDPYAGSLRYQLGLVTPNSPDCYITVDGETYYWRDGEDVVFDETFVHTAENKSTQDRLILMCDVARPVSFRPVRWFNQLFASTVMAAATAANTKQDRTGFLNILFRYLYSIRLVGKWLKGKNKTVYYCVKYALFAGLFYWIFIV